MCMNRADTLPTATHFTLRGKRQKKGKRPSAYTRLATDPHTFGRSNWLHIRPLHKWLIITIFFLFSVLLLLLLHLLLGAFFNVFVYFLKLYKTWIVDASLKCLAFLCYYLCEWTKCISKQPTNIWFITTNKQTTKNNLWMGDVSELNAKINFYRMMGNHLTKVHTHAPL